MKRSALPITLFLVASLISCGKKKDDPTAAADWRPESASVARHITTVHGFKISPVENSHLHVVKDDAGITCTFREDVLEELGNEKALYILGWKENPETLSRFEYLFFLDALHAYLVLNAPSWDGGENPAAGMPGLSGL